jgi:uncharacterized protein (TIGR00251 family)
MVEDLFDIVGGQEGDAPPDVVVRLHVQPGAGRTAVVGRHGDALKVKVSSPPQDGRANAACVTLVAETFGVPEAQVELVSGAASRSKRVRVRGVETDEVRRLLELALDDGNARRGKGVRPGAH